MRFVAALAFLLSSVPAWGGDVYSFTDERRGGLIEGVLQGRVFTDGPKYRIEMSNLEDGALDVHKDAPQGAVVSKDAGAHEHSLNLADRTYFELERNDSFPTSNALILFPVPNSTRSAKNVQLEVTEKAEPETVSGLAARRTDVQLSYDITVEMPFTKEKVRGKVKVEAVYWMAPDKTLTLPRILRPEIRTTMPEVDSKLAEALGKLRGLPVKQSVTITAEAEQSTPQKETFVTTISDLKTAETKAALFEVPSGFKHHKPEIQRPGM